MLEGVVLWKEVFEKEGGEEEVGRMDWVGLDEIKPEVLKEEVGEADILGEGLRPELGLAPVGVNKEEGDVDSVEVRVPLLVVEGHKDAEGVIVALLDAPGDLEEVIVILPDLLVEVEAVGDIETVLVLELVCVAELVVEMEFELETDLL